MLDTNNEYREKINNRTFWIINHANIGIRAKKKKKKKLQNTLDP